MRLEDLDRDVIAEAVRRQPATFATRDVSEDQEVAISHRLLLQEASFHSLVGRCLSRDRDRLGIVEVAKAGPRGSNWQKVGIAAASAPKALPVDAQPPSGVGADGGSAHSFTAWPSWDDPELLVASDSARTARYRLLQSRYRELVLGVSPGRYRNRWVGSLLDTAAVSARPGLNFLNDAAAAHAGERIAATSTERLTLSSPRLLHNMLSSMPMCFNIFGALGTQRDFGELVRQCLDSDAVDVDRPICEWNPPPSSHPLGDRTAFDALLTYRSSNGSRCFIGFETKYTEPFSQIVYSIQRYADIANGSDWFTDPAQARELLEATATNQLWRNLLLAAGLEQTGMGRGAVIVICCADDLVAHSATAAVRSQLREPDLRLRLVTLEDLVSCARDLGGSARSWAKRFGERYLPSGG